MPRIGHYFLSKLVFIFSLKPIAIALSNESEFGEPVTGIKTLIHASPNSDA